MKIEKIKIKNFRQYYGDIEIDISTEKDKNIILIGGKNGYGKTNFLLSLVWCLYGQKISQIDENFKKEIQKETNYSKFMKQSINWVAEKEGAKSFSVSLKIKDLDFPEIKSINDSITSIVIQRKYNTDSMSENLSIVDSNSNKELFEDEEDKINFINDYIIPLDAAKFVFFDAEKIAALAELSAKEEGSVLNDALGKLLGLDIYEDLVEDLNLYSNDLKKSGAHSNIKEEITNTENTINRLKTQLEDFEIENAINSNRIEELKIEIKEYDSYINQHSKNGSSQFNRELYSKKKTELETKEVELENKFNELSELIPLAILTGKIEEVKEHLFFQEQNNSSIDSLSLINEKIDEFIEKLFNQPPEPNDGSMSFKNKTFYYDKAKNLAPKIFEDQKEQKITLDFEHDLNNSDKNLIYKSIDAINIQANDLFESTIDNYNTIKIELNEVNKTISKIDSDLEDELILEYITKKETSERTYEKLIEEVGKNKANKEKIQKDIIRLNQQYQNQLQKVDITKNNKLKLEKTREYIKALQDFIDSEKLKKKDSLAKNILEEMQKLMHKLQVSDNAFVSDVNVDILPDGAGMKVTLYNSDDVEIKKEILSQGEKQLYISSLIKAILKEAIQSFPIFIDTPLGRLDDEHIKNILLYYYPDLTNQVVILSTNNEITPKRYKDISNKVSKAYLLENVGSKTHLKTGYFKSYEN